MRTEQRDKCRPSEATPHWIRTDGLYMPGCKAEAMTAAELRRGMCAKSGGDWHVCESCPGGCRIGAQLAGIMRGEIAEPRTSERAPYARPEHVKPTATVTGKDKFAPEKWREIAKAIKREVEAGSTFKEACMARGIDPGTVRNYMHTHGVAVPQNGNRLGAIAMARRAGEEARHQKAIQRAARVLAAREQGLNKEQAARAGGYARWVAAKRVLERYPAEVQAAKAAMEAAGEL